MFPDKGPQHDACPFAEVEFGQQPVIESVGSCVTNICPACNSRTTMCFSYGTPERVGEPLRGEERLPPGRKTVTVYCQCGQAHEGRPPETQENGCGAYWTVSLP